MSIDLNGAEGGRMAASFAAGCTATYVFVRNLVMKPAVKSCHQQIADLRERIDEYKDERDRLINRIGQLETILIMHGTGAIRQAVQAAISEQHLEIQAIKKST
jgi:hypothetical protein